MERRISIIRFFLHVRLLTDLTRSHYSFYTKDTNASRHKLKVIVICIRVQKIFLLGKEKTPFSFDIHSFYRLIQVFYQFARPVDLSFETSCETHYKPNCVPLTSRGFMHLLADSSSTDLRSTSLHMRVCAFCDLVMFLRIIGLYR